ncbi:MAG: hypothetical protein R3223_07535 [Longimicrobiales bacterium]|nr:hypothetical protein [Longimicrobiales bacterium]
MNPFEELRQAFRQAVENFKEELNRDQVTDTVDGLLRGMKREVVDARAYLGRLEDDLRDSVRRAEAEEEAAATCRRREELARRIDDGETEEIARKFAEKHERRAEVLRRKATALGEERDLREAEIAEMRKRLEEAARQRDSLRSRVGTTRAREILGEDDLFSELDRMEERIDDESRYADVAGEMEDLLDSEGGGIEEGATDGRRPDPSVDDLDRRLAELKRRIQEEE